MELKSLLLGLLFSMGIFAVKSGAGLSCLLARRTGRRDRLFAATTFVLGYGLLFALAWLLLNRIKLTDYLETVMHLFKGGMTIHFALAVLLLLWGTTLLGRKGEGGAMAGHGWLLLALPCPVCFSVILMSSVFLRTFFPENQGLVVWLAAGFLAVGLLSAFALARPGRRQGVPEQRLGTIMVLAGLYFLLTMVVVPQFADIDRIYRLSLAATTETMDRRLPLLAVGCALAFITGLCKTMWRTSWK